MKSAVIAAIVAAVVAAGSAGAAQFHRFTPSSSTTSHSVTLCLAPGMRLSTSPDVLRGVYQAPCTFAETPVKVLIQG